MDRPCIGVFDSGVGGLSVLRALRERLPLAPLAYVADSAHAPYGERSPTQVIERSTRIVGHLLDNHARLIVVACNTATALAIDELRSRWPQVPFVGIEPGIKPAVALSRCGRIGVMATSATVDSERMRKLVLRHGGDAAVHLQACPGLADAIEAGLDGEALDAVARPHCEALLARSVDTVVLGCTHYPLAAARIARLLGPNVMLIDTADAVSQQAARLWPQALNIESPPMRLASTGDTEAMCRLVRRWLGVDAPIERIAV